MMANEPYLRQQLPTQQSSAMTLVNKQSKFAARVSVAMFLVFALLFVGAGILKLSEAIQLAGTGERTQGTVVRVESRRVSGSSGDRIEYYPIIEYTDYSGRRHEFAGSGSTAVGSVLPVIYDPRDASRAAVAEASALWVGPIAFTLIGLAVLVFTVVMARALRKRTKALAWLERHGTRITADVIDIYTRSFQTPQSSAGAMQFRRGMVYWYIKAQFLNASDNTVYVFESEPLRFDPTSFVADKKIDVLVNPSDYSQYHVCTDTLPAAAA